MGTLAVKIELPLATEIPFLKKLSININLLCVKIETELNSVSKNRNRIEFRF